VSKKVAIIRTRSLRGGHYRAGVRHEAACSDWPSEAFTKEQLAAMEADPDLEVVTLDAPLAPKDAEAAEVAGKEEAAAPDSKAKKDKKKD
jgi:hypothetical protein